jgi:hypothetical protein
VTVFLTHLFMATSVEQLNLGLWNLIKRCTTNVPMFYTLYKVYDI